MNDLVARFERKPSDTDDDRYVSEAMTSLIRCCGTFADKLAPIALSSLDAARDYWRGNGMADELVQSRVKLWRALDVVRLRVGEQDPEWLGMRAVMCVLYPETRPDEVYDVAALFITFCSRLGVGEAELLRRIDAV
jgi:hypothetical protein